MTRDAVNTILVFQEGGCVSDFEPDPFTHVFGNERGSGEPKSPPVIKSRARNDMFTFRFGNGPESGRELFVRAYRSDKQTNMIAFDTVTSYQYGEVAQRVNSKPSPQNGWSQEGRVLPSPYDTPEMHAAIAKWMKTIAFSLGEHAN